MYKNMPIATLQKIPYYQQIEMYPNIVSDLSLKDIELKVKYLSK